MGAHSNSPGPLRRWRARRANRTQDARALRSELELDRPRGFAALRALVGEVGALQRERLATHEATSRAGAARPQRAPVAKR